MNYYAGMDVSLEETSICIVDETVVNVSSAIGSLTLNANPDFPFRPYFGATYPASKTALNAMSLALAVELENSGIKVRAASPGFTATAMNTHDDKMGRYAR